MITLLLSLFALFGITIFGLQKLIHGINYQPPNMYETFQTYSNNNSSSKVYKKLKEIQKKMETNSKQMETNSKQLETNSKQLETNSKQMEKRLENMYDRIRKISTNVDTILTNTIKIDKDMNQNL